MLASPLGGCGLRVIRLVHAIVDSSSCSLVSENGLTENCPRPLYVPSFLQNAKFLAGRGSAACCVRRACAGECGSICVPDFTRCRDSCLACKPQGATTLTDCATFVTTPPAADVAARQAVSLLDQRDLRTHSQCWNCRIAPRWCLRSVCSLVLSLRTAATRPKSLRSRPSSKSRYCFSDLSKCS